MTDPTNDPTTDAGYAELIDPDGRPTLVFRRQLRHTPAKVWRALTDDADLAAWFPTTIEGERATGAALRFEFRAEDEYAAGLPGFGGTMIACDEPHHLELTWGEHVLRFDLEAGPHDGGSTLTLTVRLEELGVAARDAAGWHVSLDNLANRLDGVASVAPDAWKPVNADYNDRFGPAASAIGPPEGHGLA